MYRGVFCKPILDDDADRLALGHAYLRARDTTVVTPDIGVGIRLADHRPSRRAGDERELSD
jgi:hypothetical protein